MIGTDIASNNGDFSTSAQGDMTTVSGKDNLTLRLQRRFGTPYGSLFYDRTYGNKLFDRLSGPMGRNFEQEAISDATECLLGDSAVQSISVTLSIQHESRIVQFSIRYVAKDGTAGSFDQGVAYLV